MDKINAKKKKSIINYIKYSIKVILTGMVSVIILSLITIVYNFTGVHISNLTGATDYVWEANQLKTTMVEGFAWIKMDANGFNNSFISKDSNIIDILLMGSSHMEAVNVASNENVGYKLNEFLKDDYVYNIGISGHTIYNCLNNLEQAISTYHPLKYVILETDTIELSISSMQDVINGNFAKIESYDQGILYWLQKNIPAIKIIYKQVDEWKNVERKGQILPNTLLESDDEYKNVLSKFLNKASLVAKDNSVKLLIFYQPHTKIDEHGNLISDTNNKYLSLFKQTCLENDIIFVDMTDDFSDLYNSKHILAHGFNNTAVGVGHLNKYGHIVIAKKLASIIEMEEK